MSYFPCIFRDTVSRNRYAEAFGEELTTTDQHKRSHPKAFERAHAGALAILHGLRGSDVYRHGASHTTLLAVQQLWFLSAWNLRKKDKKEKSKTRKSSP